MSFVVCKHPAVRMDLMILEEIWPRVASLAQANAVTYEKEEHVVPEGGKDKYVILRDLKGHCPVGGNNLGEFIGQVYTLSIAEAIAGGKKKFYVMISPRKRGKKDDEPGKENRQKADSGSEGGN